MDTVFIRGLRVHAIIGARDWEREVKQTLLFDIELPTDVRRAAASDLLADTVDYSEVAKVVDAVVTSGEFQLIETAAEHVAERLMTAFTLAWVRVDVTKPSRRPGAYTKGVSIERGLRG